MNETIDIDARIDTVWAIFSDVENWATWTASVTSVEPLDGGRGQPIAVGRAYRVRQPKFPPAVWTVTEVSSPNSFTWSQQSFGSRATAHHRLTAVGPQMTRVELGINQGGPIGRLVGRLAATTTRRYLRTETAGLKAASEQRASSAGA
jgi:hypothetical protein